MICEDAVETMAVNAMASAETNERMSHQLEKVLLWDVRHSVTCTPALWGFVGLTLRLLPPFLQVAPFVHSNGQQLMIRPYHRTLEILVAPPRRPAHREWYRR